MNEFIEVEIEVSNLFKMFDFDKDEGEMTPNIFIEIETPFGWKKINSLIKTEENEEWEIETKNTKGIFADYHKVETIFGDIDYSNDKKWSFIKELSVGDKIITKNGEEEILSIRKTGKTSKMYDFEINDVFCYYANNISSHNSMTLKFLRTKADNHNIEFEVFNDIKEFTDNADDYFRDEKKIFVFEDFDTALLDRDNTGGTPNQILGKILNILDGVREIDNVVSIFTTNKINLFDDAFIRPGRIDTVFTFSLPSDNDIKEFVDKYLFDFDKDYVMKVIFDIKPTTNISFAYLKGIADDLNIYNFFQGKMPEKKDIEKIIRERSVQTNKGTDKDVSSYIL